MFVQMLDIQQPMHVWVLRRQNKSGVELELTPGEIIRFEAEPLPRG